MFSALMQIRLHREWSKRVKIRRVSDVSDIRRQEVPGTSPLAGVDAAAATC